MQDEFEYIRNKVEETRQRINNMKIPESDDIDDCLHGVFPDGIRAVVHTALENADNAIHTTLGGLSGGLFHEIGVSLRGVECVMESVGEVLEGVGVVIEEVVEDIVDESLGSDMGITIDVDIDNMDVDDVDDM